MDGSVSVPFKMERLGLVMQSDPVRSDEAEGVLNPGAVRGRDGELYLFPRLVAKGNYSRVGMARVRFDDSGNPRGVERLGYALEPSAPYEVRPQGTGGCEDPRVTYFEPLDLYVMAYAAWGPGGPRVAAAVSEDLYTWRRFGLVNFDPDPDPIYGVVFDNYHNKDAAFFPRVVAGPDGRPSLAMLHRPVYTQDDLPKGIVDLRPSIWISYCALEDAHRDPGQLTLLRQHHVLIDPEYPWEELRIGSGTPPVLTHLGWLVIYHGVSGYIAQTPGEQNRVRYTAGALVLDQQDPRRVLYRSTAPILEPQVGEEREGVVPNVVFPTGLDSRGKGRIDVYYGMADTHIGAARLTVPESLPANDAR